MRKHRAAWIAIAVYNAVFFFPLLFMGRVVSPNDVFYNYFPWSTARPAEIVQTQNSLLNDPPTAYYTLMSMLKDDWGTFHWNPYVGAGIPGFGSTGAAVLSPFILLPVLLLPLTWVYTGILFLKLNAAFLFAYLWLREERLGKRGAAIGAVVIAGAGIYAVRWLWQITNATALYPALLWLVRRSFNGRRNPVSVVALVALAFALSGFPAAMAYAAWIVLAYSVWLAVRHRIWRSWQGVLPLVSGVLIAFLIALPFIIPFGQLLRRSGYLEMRKAIASAGVFPLQHGLSFVDPERLGNPALKSWIGDPALGALNNYIEATVYVGLLTIPLALIGLLRRRARERWFWGAAALFVLGCMFGAPLVRDVVPTLPGFKYSALARVALLLPLPLGYLAAAAVPRRARRAYSVAAIALAALLAYDLAYFAGRFHPYLEPAHAAVPETAVTRFLRTEPGPFRVAPFFDYLWPNAAELVRFEDVRSHFGSEAAYRRMLQRIDPTSWSGVSTVMTFNSLHFDFSDPFTALLGIRYYIEQPPIDIVKWGIFSATVPGVRETGTLALRAGELIERTIVVDAEPFWAIELPVKIEQSQRGGVLEVSLWKHGARTWSRRFTASEANALGKVYVPLRPYARLGESVVIRLQSRGVRGWMLEGENDDPAESPLFYGRVTTPLVFDRELPDGRIFRNLAELPRFRAVSGVRKLNDEEFLALRNVDFATETVITDDPVMPPELGGASDARVTLTHYSPAEQRIVTESTAPFFLASTEKLTPELQVKVGGRVVRAIEVDMMFAGIPVPAGRHEVVFSRRLARGWWWTAIAGVVLLFLALVRDVWIWRRRE